MTVDFTKKILAGHVTHVVEVVTAGTETVVFDTKALNISEVKFVGPFDAEHTHSIDLKVCE